MQSLGDLTHGAREPQQWGYLFGVLGGSTLLMLLLIAILGGQGG